jgi:hypothetical protein
MQDVVRGEVRKRTLRRNRHPTMPGQHQQPSWNTHSHPRCEEIGDAIARCRAATNRGVRGRNLQRHC